MTSLRTQLLSVEDDFLEALTDGGSALSEFERRWDKLLADVNEAFDLGRLDDETTAFAHTTALRIAALADTSADLLASRDEITSDLMEQINTLISQVAISPPPTVIKRSTAARSVSLDEGTLDLSKSRKRCRDDSESLSEQEVSPSKRRRSPSDSEIFVTAASPPQLPHSLQSSSLSTVPLSVPHGSFDLCRDLLSPIPRSTSSRKRCLSDADTASFPSRKRPNTMPTLHIAPNPFPAASPRSQLSLPSTTELWDEVLEKAPTSHPPCSGTSIRIESLCGASSADLPCDVTYSIDDIHSSESQGHVSESISSDLEGSDLDNFLTTLLNCNVAPSLPSDFLPLNTCQFGESPSPSEFSSCSSSSSCSSPTTSTQSLPTTPRLCATDDTLFPSYNFISLPLWLQGVASLDSTSHHSTDEVSATCLPRDQLPGDRTPATGIGLSSLFGDEKAIALSPLEFSDSGYWYPWSEHLDSDVATQLVAG